jgi:hypothetical protein
MLFRSAHETREMTRKIFDCFSCISWVIKVVYPLDEFFFVANLEKEYIMANTQAIPYRRVYVWQLPVRFYHWLNALCVVVLIATGYLIGKPLAITYSSEAYQQYWFGTVRFIHFVTAFVFFFQFSGAHLLGLRRQPVRAGRISSCSKGAMARDGRSAESGCPVSKDQRPHLHRPQPRWRASHTFCPFSSFCSKPSPALRCTPA